ncbi:hypothetical protein C2E25_07060 [Geothermobacter hydrogeniphilus]|uniref:Uncharacterized protein n=1 Tax=Geothermobacter hydrogeniphilus TaxID=1969733 RepID=A0A2K2HAZ3_9BACT|nr:hypothetical protein C2E25_07060 [Geothermobacter hydrogeniphilus]
MRRFFQQLNWLVFFAYLLFGLGGGVAVACCAADPAACLSDQGADAAVGCLEAAGSAQAPCHPCYNHHRAAGVDTVHLVSFQPSSRVADGVAAPAFSFWQDLSSPPPVTESSLHRALPQPNSVLASLRTIILLI